MLAVCLAKIRSHAFVSVLLLLVSCGLDPTFVKPVVIRNGTDIVVIVDSGVNAPGTNTHISLQPGTHVEGSWRLSSEPARIRKTVRAFDQNNQLIFCRYYTADAGDRSSLTVTITHGDIRC
jgi:hypothetical protein